MLMRQRCAVRDAQHAHDRPRLPHLDLVAGRARAARVAPAILVRAGLGGGDAVEAEGGHGATPQAMRDDAASSMRWWAKSGGVASLILILSLPPIMATMPMRRAFS